MDEDGNGNMGLEEFLNLPKDQNLMRALHLHPDDMATVWGYLHIGADHKNADVYIEDMLFAYLKVKTCHKSCPALIKDFGLHRARETLVSLTKPLLQLEAQILHVESLLKDQVLLMVETTSYIQSVVPPFMQRLSHLESQVADLLKAAALPTHARAYVVGRFLTSELVSLRRAADMMWGNTSVDEAEAAPELASADERDEDVQCTRAMSAKPAPTVSTVPAALTVPATLVKLAVSQEPPPVNATVVPATFVMRAIPPEDFASI
eukprot:gnl/TRDRNA2_/TRDRNA2_174443_c0_seq4.p1 gnl/TRDRNA2_/TRDRNA2_174443_c0~~gnl/TRDRNA2_/TRDRNA2_174443_c0_seq4.p1  ORF type:complete len:274 (+),score=50.38 gnl/TRDRNA2_/TRDRNA2_174443_c0_seq4:34-822(+)